MLNLVTLLVRDADHPLARWFAPVGSAAFIVFELSRLLRGVQQLAEGEQRATAEAAVRRLAAEDRKLTSPAYVEQQARDRLHMCMPNQTCYVVIPGKKPTDTRRVQLRLVVTKDQYLAQYRPDAKGEFQTAMSGKLAPGEGEKVSIQCYNGPPGKEHWMRFSDFKILKLSD